MYYVVELAMIYNGLNLIQKTIDNARAVALRVETPIEAFM